MKKTKAVTQSLSVHVFLVRAVRVRLCGRVTSKAVKAVVNYIRRQLLACKNPVTSPVNADSRESHANSKYIYSTSYKHTKVSHSGKDNNRKAWYGANCMFTVTVSVSYYCCLSVFAQRGIYTSVSEPGLRGPPESPHF